MNMDKEKIFYCFDSNFNIINSIEATQGCAFLYVIDLAETKQRMRELGFITDGIDEEGGHFWDDIEVEWTLCTKEEQEEMEKAIEKSEKNINCYQPPMQSAAKVGESIPKKPKTILYDLFIYVKDWDYKMQSNSQPITFEEALEALTLLRKPCLFGDLIEEYRIVKHEE